MNWSSVDGIDLVDDLFIAVTRMAAGQGGDHQAAECKAEIIRRLERLHEFEHKPDVSLPRQSEAKEGVMAEDDGLRDWSELHVSLMNAVGTYEVSVTKYPAPKDKATLRRQARIIREHIAALDKLDKPFVGAETVAHVVDDMIRAEVQHPDYGSLMMYVSSWIFQLQQVVQFDDGDTPQPAQADTTPAAHGVGDGMVVVPVVPTSAMFDAGFKACEKQYGAEQLDDMVGKVTAIYVAMLQAASAPGGSDD